MTALRALVTLAGLIVSWQALVMATGLPPYLLPAPTRVARALVARWDILWHHTQITMLEIALGLVLGVLFGASCALTLAASRYARRWLMPILIASQAMPTFAIAPLLVLWFGYGLGSKIVMAIIVIFFTVASSFYDGLRRTEPGWLDLARTMSATPMRILWLVRVPAALPSLATGVRVAAVYAPVGAIIGEWVGASRGLGYLMLQSNARMQIDMLFAALLLLATFSMALYALVDALLRRLIAWAPERLSDDD
ncbi:MAG: ABC transporter permease [Alphaproteobacteria bacterium]|nr:ABC transporter permease [Alphaproteobacteria bacterium]